MIMMELLHDLAEIIVGSLQCWHQHSLHSGPAPADPPGPGRVPAGLAFPVET